MKKYKRQTFLIYPKLQLRMSLLIASLTFISNLIYPISIVLIINKYSTINSELQSSPITSNFKINELIITLASIHILITLLTFILGLIFSHKIVGPIYKLKLYLKSLRNKNFTNQLSFRTGDYFLDIATDVNLTIKELKDTFFQDLVFLTESKILLNKINNEQKIDESSKQSLNLIIERLNSLEEKFLN